MAGEPENAITPRPKRKFAMHTSSRQPTLLITTAFALFFVTALPPASTAVPLAPDAAATYTARCAKCHGADGRGVEKYKKQGAKDFTEAKWQKSRTDAQLTTTISNGKGDVMPAWKTKLSADEIKALVAHIRAFGKH